MAFIHGKTTTALVNEYNLSAFFNDASVSYSADTAETTAFGNDSKTYLIGLDDGTLSLNGMFEGTTSGVDTVVAAVLASGSVPNQATSSVIYGTPAAGTSASLVHGLINNYDISAPVSDVVAATLEVQGSGGVASGKALSALAAVSATTTGSAVDRGEGASTTAGTVVAHLHVPTNDRDAGTLTAKITTSATEGGVYADVTGGGFTAVAGGSAAFQRLEISGAVNRYVKVVYTVAGGSSGSYTPIVTLSAY